MPTKNPHSPSDETTDWGTQSESGTLAIGGNPLLPVMMFIMLVGLGVGFWIYAVTTDYTRMEFMSACIEHHSAGRCRELYEYNRLDLAKPR